MIEDVYDIYFERLLAADRTACTKIVERLLEADVPIRTLYVDLFQRSLYQVGDLWEANRVSVSREHMVTAMTESLMGIVYPKLFAASTPGAAGKAVVSCCCNEFHQIGGKMVADILEMNGWDTQFMGANLPGDQLLRHIAEEAVDLVGLSLSVYFNFAALEEIVLGIRKSFPNLDIIVGGRAFQWGGVDRLTGHEHTHYVPTLDALEARWGMRKPEGSVDAR